MSMRMYMSITGKSQGEIKAKSEDLSNSNEHADRKDRIVVYEHKHVTSNKVNKDTGIPEGGFEQSLSVTKMKDVTSPKIFQLCCERELCSMELFFFRTADSKDKVYYIEKLEGAYVYKIESFTPMIPSIGNENCCDMETLYFSYAKLTQLFTDGNIEYTESSQGR